MKHLILLHEYLLALLALALLALLELLELVLECPSDILLGLQLLTGGRQLPALKNGDPFFKLDSLRLSLGLPSSSIPKYFIISSNHLQEGFMLQDEERGVITKSTISRKLLQEMF